MLNRQQRRQLERDIKRAGAAGAVDLAALRAEPTTVFMGYCAGENVRTLFHESLLHCAARSVEFGYLLRPKLVESGPQLDKARNFLARAFLATEDPYLLFVDTDIVFSPLDVKTLLEAQAPIAGALYFTAAAGYEPWPTALEWDREAESAEGTPDEGTELSEPSLVPIKLPEPPEDFDPADPSKLSEWMETGLQPRTVDAVGCGLMLIRRDVVQAVSDAHDGRPFTYEGERGEDVNFCLRAAALGFESKLVPQARVGHLKVTVL